MHTVAPEKQHYSPLIKRADGDTGDIGLMGHLVVDWPSPADCAAIVETMVHSGARVIEVQIPFSEPMADGPVIMAANHGAIAAGVTVARCFEFMKEMTTRFDLPFVFMTYANVIFKHGWRAFVEDAVAVGARGVIVPDLPLELSADFDAACKDHRFANIRVIPPNVTEERLTKICAAADGLIYAVARAGVTGAPTDFGQDLREFVGRIRARSDLPIAIGFGIASAKDVACLRGVADLAVIGSQTFREHAAHGISGVEAFWSGLLTHK